VDVTERADPQPGQCGLRRPEQAHVHAVDRDGGDQHDDDAEQHEPGDQTHVGATGGRQPAVDDLLDGDRHDHPARGGQQREHEGDRQSAAELRHHPQTPAQGGESALASFVCGQQRLAHTATSACE